MKMIKIEMQFSSIDEALHALSAMQRDPQGNAQREAALVEMVRGQQSEAPAPNFGKQEGTSAPAETKAESPKDQPAAAPSSPKPGESQAAGAADECTYDDLKKSIMKLVAIDPKHMREIADSFGVKTFQGTTADVWPKAKKAVDDKISALRS